MIAPQLDDESLETRTRRAAAIIAAAETILIGAGAGLSAAAGHNFTDRQVFARDYPGMLQYGFTHKLQMMANFSVPDELLWGYYLQNVQETRFGRDENHVYQDLRAIAESKSAYFVITTNVDGLFQRNGFNAAALYTPQGDYAFAQCRKPCSERVWPVEPLLAAYLPMIDRATQMLPRGEVPRCPYCGGPTFLNVRCAHWFVDAPWKAGEKAYGNWLRTHADHRLVALDIGSGFNTPGWVRWPLEELVATHPQTTLLRINREHPEVPEKIRSRCLIFREDASRVIASIAGHLGVAPSTSGL